MNNKTFTRLIPVFWSSLIFIVTQAFAFLVISRENPFLEKNNIEIPAQPPQVITIWPGPVTSPSGQVTQVPAESSLGPILIYFFAVVIVLGVVLFTIPISALQKVFRVLFAVLFGWSLFVISIFWLPWVASLSIAVVFGLSWVFFPRVWLQSLSMLLAMVALGAVFGRFISPWTAMILLAALAVYDFLAVRFGFMLWMVKKLSGSSTLPAFVIPYRFSEWTSSLKKPDIVRITEEKSTERKFAILGGGDIGFPVLLASSVYFADGLNKAAIIAVFSLAGLISAYWIQAKFLKGKAIPALPPIAVFSLIGLILISTIH